MRRCLLSLLFLSLLTASALAQFGLGSAPGVRLGGRSVSDLVASQKILLSNYCRLDYAGARLQPDGWNRFKPFTTLRTNPEFNRVIVVSRYDIETPAQPTEVLYVNYQTVGYYQQDEGYSALSSSDRGSFHVQEQNGNLLVTEVKPEAPHVSPRAALAWMKSRLTDPKISDLERAHLNNGVDALNKLVPRPATNTP